MVGMIVGSETVGAMRVEAQFEFAVSRRMPWGEDLDSLARHVDAVHQRLVAHKQVNDAEVTTDPDAGRVFVRFVVAGVTRTAGEAEARTVLGGAIRDASAYHDGLFPHQSEYTMVPRLHSWSGLRTPTWQVRRTRFTTEVSSEASAG